jgi:hypothetical protein
VLLLLGGVLVPSLAQAGVVPPLTKLKHAIVGAVGNDSTFIARGYGSDTNNPLYDEDEFVPSTGSFTYSLVPNSTYHGKPITQSAVGQFNNAAGQWEWTTTIDRAGVVLDVNGTIAISDGGVVGIQAESGPYAQVYNGTIETTPDGGSLGVGVIQQYYLGAPIGSPYSVRDFISADGQSLSFDYGVAPENFIIRANGVFYTPTEGHISFTITFVPEHATWIPFAAGILSLLAYRCRASLPVA